MKRDITIHFESIGSTNTWAKERINEFDADALTIITADEQTAGRGRFKRVWHSPKNMNLYITFCFFVEAHFTSLGHIPQLLALSASQALEEIKFYPLLKWPNDLMLAGKKLGGILCETTSWGRGRGVIVGLGLNVNMPLEELIKIDRPATSLLVEGKQALALQTVCQLIKHQYKNNLALFFKDGFVPFFAEYEKRSFFKKGEKVIFHDNQSIVKGFFEKLNSDGSVSLLLNSGQPKTFYAGEFISEDN